MSSEAAPFPESEEERDARLTAEWAAMTPEERRERDRQIDLGVLARCQAIIDESVIKLGGNDQPAYRLGPDGDQVLVAVSTLSALLGLKSKFVYHTARVRRGEPLV